MKLRLKTKYTGLLALTLLAAGAAPLPAQQAYTLEECVEQALQNNIRIKNADNDLRAAELQRKSAFTNYFPTVSATGLAFGSTEGLMQVDMAPGERLSMLKHGAAGGVVATVPLFTGGQIVHGNQLAKVGVEASRLRRRQSEDEVRLTAEQYFWQVAMLKEKRRTIDQLQEQLARLCSDAEAAVEAGVAQRNDLLQARLRANETRSSRVSVDNALATARRLLAQYMGCPADSIDVAATMDGGLPEPPDALYRSPADALPQTAAYGLLGKDVEANRLQYKMTRGKNLPTVALGGGYMYDNFTDKDRPYWIGGVTVSLPLTKWWGGSHEMKRQRLQVSNAENRLKDQGELLVIRMQNAWSALSDAYLQVGIAVESIAQSQENLRLQADSYQAGTCTMSDLLEAQSLYQQARDKYVESYAQYEIRKREYLQATGR